MIFICNLGFSARGDANPKRLKVRLAIDGSASMKGYFKAGRLTEFIEHIVKVSQSAQVDVNSKVFLSSDVLGNTPLEWIDWSEWSAQPEKSRTWGQYTYLTQAMQAVSRGAEAVILITDNFEAGQDDIGDSSKFYQSIRDSAYELVYFFPYLIPFSGNIDIPVNPALGNKKQLTEGLKSLNPSGGYSLLSGRPSQIGNQKYWKIQYKGDRGIAVYLLVNIPKKRTVLREMKKNFDVLIQHITRFEPSFGKYLLQLYPLGKDSVGIGQGDTQSFRGQPCLTPRDRTLLKSIKPETLSRFTAADAMYTIELAGHEADYDPKQRGIFRFLVNLKIEERGHFSVVHQSCSDTRSMSINIDGFKVRVLKSHLGNILKDPLGPLQARIIPEKMILHDTPAGLVGSALVEVEIPELIGKQVRADVIAEGLEASFNLSIQIPKKQFQLKPAIDRAIFSSSTLDLKKIYTSEGILSHIVPPERDHVAINYDVQISPKALTMRQSTREPPKEDESSLLPIILIVAALLIAFSLLKPLGMTVALAPSDVSFAKQVKVSGVINRLPSAVIKLSDGQEIVIDRYPLHGKRLRVMKPSGEVLAFIIPGQRTKLDAVSTTKIEHYLEWLSKDREAHFRAQNKLDEV